MAESSFMQGNPDHSVPVVPFSDDEDKTSAKADDLDEDSPTASPEERLTRKRKRQERLQQLLAEGKQSKEELAALKNESAATKAELERMKGFLQAQQQQPQRPANDTAQDPYETQLRAIYAEQADAYNAAQAELKAGTMTPERQKHYEKKAEDIEARKTRVHVDRAIEADRSQRRIEQAQQVWVQKYPEVYNNPRAFQYAQASWQRRLALGEQQSNALVDEIMTEAITQFRLGGKPAPTASEKSRMMGTPSAGAGGTAKPAGIAMTSELKRIARAAHPDLPEEEAYKKWANTTGKRLRERKVL